MRIIKTTHAISTFGTGLFAGLLYTFQQSVIPTLLGLSGPDYTRVEQGLTVHLDAFPTGVIVVGTVAMLLPLYPLVRLFTKRKTAYWKLTFLGWFLFCFGVTIFTIVFNVPLNEYIMTWNVARPPADWEQVRQTWNVLNMIRTPLNLISFMLLIWASFHIGEVEDR